MRRAFAIWAVGVGLLAAFPSEAQDEEDSEISDSPEEALAEGEAFPGMTGLVDEAVRKLAKKANEEALAKLKQKDYPGALELFREAHDLDSKDAEIANNLGYIYYLLGNSDEAEKALRSAIALDPKRYAAYLNLADLLGREGETKHRLSEAAALLKKARELQGNRQRVIIRQARVARRRGAVAEALRFYKEYSSSRAASDKVLVEIGDYLRELGREEDAFRWYKKVDDADEWGKEAAGRIWEMEVERQAQRYGWSRRTGEVPEKARALATRARELINAAKAGEARRLLEKALTLAPGYAVARAALGDALRRLGEPAAAELSYLQALAMDNDNAEIYVRLGELYLAGVNRKRSAEAVLYLRRALELRPDWRAVHLTLARALQRAGEMASALHHLDIFLEREPAGPKRQEALGLKRTIEKLWSGADERRDVASQGGVKPALSQELAQALTSARAHVAEGRLDAAMAELRRVPKESRGTLVLNLEARILHASGRLKEAAHKLSVSLSLDESQTAVHEQLGVILMELGRENRARKHFNRAEALGNVMAMYHLARLDSVSSESVWTEWAVDLARLDTLFTALKRLNSFLAEKTSPVYSEEARTLRDSLETRIWTVFGVLSGLAVGLVLLLVFAASLMWGGVDLSALITRYPDSGPEVQRVLSAIRHEVLKHNTLALGGVVESIEREGEDAAEKASHFNKSLLGGEGDESVKGRLDKYALELRKIGRAYGVRLNLKRKEPAISLLYQGFGILDEASGALAALETQSALGKVRLLGMLKKAFRLLNVDGYEAVQQMLGKIRMLEVDESLLRGIVVRVLREPAFSKVDVAPLALDVNVPLPLAVLVSRRAFDDIFVNLVRNAVQSSLEMGLSPVEIGITVDLEVDEVTGLERALFLVNDRSTKALTTEMIRAQAIEGGLGLTADLVSRYDGSVDVVPGEKGWHKAVRVKMPVSWEMEEAK
jgi:Flp pilus assembly protein TadD